MTSQPEGCLDRQHHDGLYKHVDLAWSVANQVDHDLVRDRIRLAFAGIERIDHDPALQEARLHEIETHLEAASTKAATDDVRDLVGNALEHLAELQAVAGRPAATDGGAVQDDDAPDREPDSTSGIRVSCRDCEFEAVWYPSPGRERHKHAIETGHDVAYEGEHDRGPDGGPAFRRASELYDATGGGRGV